MWIEMTGLFVPEGIDYEALGIEINESEAEEGKILVNMSNVSAINESEGGKTTVWFVDGERMLFKDQYEEVKKRIRGRNE